LRSIADPLQDAPIRLVRLIQLVVYFLDVAQADRCQYGGKDIPGYLAVGYRFGIRLAGRSTFSLNKMGKSQCPERCGADSGIIWWQIFQSAARLGKHGFYIVPCKSQYGSGAGDSSDPVSSLAIRLAALSSS